MQLKLLIIFLFAGLYACGQHIKYVPDPRAKKLNDSAIYVMRHQWLEKAIVLLDQAIEIDSNYFAAISNKFTCQLLLKKYEAAIVTAKMRNRLRPQNPDFYVTTGLLYIKTNDSINAKNYFAKAAVHYDAILDTMSKANRSYNVLLMDKAEDLILLGEEVKGNAILNQLYDNTKDTLLKELVKPYLGKSKQQMVDLIFNPPNTGGGVGIGYGTPR